MTRLTHRKTFVKLLVSMGLGGHDSKLGPYKIQKLKDLAFFFSSISLPQYGPIKLYLARGRRTGRIIIS